MFRIGEFSRIARVSTRLLRYYDQIQLFSPMHTDESTGYRYYSARQLPQLNRIFVLKELGFSLEQIAHLLSDEITTEELRGMLLLRRADVENALQEEKRRLLQIESRLTQIETAGQLDQELDIVRKSLPARRALSYRAVFPSPKEIMAVLQELLQFAWKRPEFELFAIMHAEEFEPNQLDVEVGLYLESSGRPPEVACSLGPLQQCHHPAVESAATLVRMGPPDQAHQKTGQLAQWIEAQGYQIAGSNRELFLHKPPPDRMEQAVIEMQFPVVLR